MADEKKPKREKDPRPASIVKSERAVNSILGALERLGRRGKGLTEVQKSTVLKTLNDGFARCQAVLAGKAKANTGFSLGE